MAAKGQLACIIESLGCNLIRYHISGALLSPLMSLTNNEIQTTVAAIEAKFRSPTRRQSADQFSDLARLVMLSNTSSSSTNATNSATNSPPPELVLPPGLAPTSAPRDKDGVKPPPKSALSRALNESSSTNQHLQPNGTALSHGRALTDTPLPSAPGSPHMYEHRLPETINAN